MNCGLFIQEMNVIGAGINIRDCMRSLLAILILILIMLYISINANLANPLYHLSYRFDQILSYRDDKMHRTKQSSKTE